MEPEQAEQVKQIAQQIMDIGIEKLKQENATDLKEKLLLMQEDSQNLAAESNNMLQTISDKEKRTTTEHRHAPEN